MKRVFSLLCIAMIVVSVSGCVASMLFRPKDENVQYIPESIKDMPKESLAEIRIDRTLVNRPIVSIDDTLIHYPFWGSGADQMTAIFTFGFAGYDLCIYVTEGKHIFRRMYLYESYYREGQYVTTGARRRDFWGRWYVVTKPGVVPSGLVGKYYQQSKPEIGSFYVKKGEKIHWKDIKKDITENVNLDEPEHSIEEQNEAELSIEESSN